MGDTAPSRDPSGPQEGEPRGAGSPAGRAEDTQPAPVDSSWPMPAGDPVPGWAAPPPGGDPPGFDTAPRPGVVPLRPLGLGDLFGGAFAAVRANPTSTLLPTAVVAVVVQLVQYLTRGGMRPRPLPTTMRLATRYLGEVTSATVPGALLGLLLAGAVTALIVVVVHGAVIGRRTGPGEAWRAARRRIPGVIGVSLVVGLVIAVIAVIGVFVTIGAALTVRGGLGAALGILFALATAAVVVYVAVLFAFAMPAYVLEPVGVGTALRRSATLVRGAWWRVFGIVLLATVGVAVLWAVVGVVVALFARLAGPAAAPLVPRIAGVAVSLVVTPVITGLTTLLYVDRRIRRERYDLQLASWAAAPR